MNRDEYAIMYRVEETHWWYRSLRGMLRLYGDSIFDGGRVLDVGCGTGANMAAFDLSWGIDYSMDAIRFCRSRGLVRTAAASAVALPIASESFDAAISCDVLCHRSIRDKGAMLREIARVLRPGGLFLINLPAYQWLYSSHDVHVQTDRRFTKREAAGLLAGSGFETMRATYWNTLTFPAAASVRLWRKWRPPASSDLGSGSGEGANAMLEAILSSERFLAGHWSMPFGLSVLLLARKT